ncbi:MAG: hypothetical protein ABJD24_14150 [Acidimicrobiales bacterium]
MTSPRRFAVGAAAFTLLVTACAHGARPSFGVATTTGSPSTTSATGDPLVDQLLSRIDGVSSQTFTATYVLTRKLGGQVANGTVAQQPPKLAITVRDTKFFAGDQERTCTISTKHCEDGISAQLIADVATSTGFYGPAAAAEIRVSMGRRNSAPTNDAREIAGQPATCITIPVGTGEEVYCVLTTGVIALTDRADVRVEMTSYVPAADAAAFTI